MPPKSGITIDYSDLRELQKNLRRAPAEVKKKINRELLALRNQVRDEIRDEAPARTGATRKGIRGRGGGSKPAVVIAGRLAKPPRPDNIAYLLGRGHRLRGGGRTKPNEFVRRAMERELPDFNKNVRRLINRNMKKYGFK